MTKQLFREADTSRTISEIQFMPFCAEDIEQLSHVQILDRNLYQENNVRNAESNGPLDNKMGTSIKAQSCSTCNRDLIKCVGHYGHVEFDMPIFHLGFFKPIMKILQMICKSCSSLLLKPDDRKKFLIMLSRDQLSFLQRKATFKKIHSTARKISYCPSCGDFNGIVKKFGFMKIVHVKYKDIRKNRVMIDEYLHTFDRLKSYHKDMEKLLEPGYIVLNPLIVYQLFDEIKQEDVRFFLMNTKFSHPRDLLMKNVLAPPLCIRPTVISETRVGTNEDDLTIKISEMIYLTNVMIRNKDSSSKLIQNLEAWEFLQLQAALYINSEVPRIPLSMAPSKWTRCFAQRLKGKQGRFRGNLSGKRVDFSGRTVISPDPNLQIDQVSIPIHVAKTLTFPTRVTRFNIAMLAEMVRNGPDIYPGANFITLKSNSVQKFLKYGNRVKASKELSDGDIVERHLIQGDIVLFNRQPSLHKLSILSMRANISQNRTFSFNECICNPFNADFDGDEMNIHVPQTEESRTEALILMSTKANLVSPRNGEMVIGATQDFLTGSYLLTKKDYFMTRATFSHLFTWVLADKYHNEIKDIVLPKPAILKPCCLWTGKQLFSVLIQSCDNSLKTNLRAKTKFYSGNEDLNSNDEFVVIRNSELMCGNLDKSILGAGGKDNIFYVILRDYNENLSAKLMWKISRLSSFFLMNRGFSIGISDVKPDCNLTKEKVRLVQQGYSQCEDYIQQLKDGKLVSQPGCTEEETLESLINGKLSDIRENAGTACFQRLPTSNAPLIMALSGSKGSKINISQMVACVGQQTISGARIPDGFENRSLPHFEKHSKLPPAKGFVRNSFFTGLTPTEFFFHAMAGREGLVDTAVKTAETGYMQRRLVKCLEDLRCEYDMTVRTSSGDIVQFLYGSDGLDPSFMEAKSQPFNLERVLHHCKAIYCNAGEDFLQGDQIDLIVQNTLNSNSFKLVSDKVKNDIKNFCSELSNRIRMQTSTDLLFKQNIPMVLYQIDCITRIQLNGFLEMCRNKYCKAIVEPGTAVGALCAQSIGEPCTQMTLKTFHFAGVASMNITLGVPRIKELVNAVKNISTPIITAQLTKNDDVSFARLVKGRVEKTFLSEISSCIEEVYLPHDCFLHIRLDMDRIRLLHLEISPETVINAIASAKLQIRINQMSLHGENGVIIRVGDNQKGNLYYTLQRYKEDLMNVVVKGISAVSRAIISLENDNRTHKLLVEGSGFKDVIGTYGIDGLRTTSNDILETYSVLGIEAARQTIINEVIYTMSSHGISVDYRHVMLLADLMTCKGEVLGLTRNGLAKMKESVLMLASFEQTIEHLYDAAYYGQKDVIAGVSERIILGLPIRLGTGIFDLLSKPAKRASLSKRDLIFDTEEYHVKI
ncbi:hypothetical protein GJ496_005322 [Pomphorhynchus laevis]|nr:hypothetical protein GJ496_005322 [Pomphorhynchus laevis]